MAADSRKPLSMNATYPGMPISKLFVTIFRDELRKALLENRIPGVSLNEARFRPKDTARRAADKAVAEVISSANGGHHAD